MHIDLVIITDEKLNIKTNNLNYQIFDSSHYLVDDYTLNTGITFDYLITSSLDALKHIDLLKDEDYIICNYFFQTSKEHIFFIGKENKSTKSIQEQLDTVIDFFNNN
ncbi:MAG TPA: hypothetical protein GX740_02855 [Acholeplasmataceae bacterium]|nr:hypothetical protein [Acholeplasmataceae bacterium]